MHLDLLFHCCTGKGAKTKLHQQYPHRKKQIPPLSRKLVFFSNRNTQKNMQLLDKIHTVFTAALTASTMNLYQTPGTFSRQTLLEALILTGASDSYFGQQYLLYLHQKLDENNRNQQVQTAVQQYIQYKMVCSYVAANSVLFADGDTTSESAVRQQGEELHG